MRIAFNNPKIKFCIGDVRDITSVNDAMEGVNFVFHAAALKQVPSCEFYPMEAIKTNVLGADNVLSASIQHGVSKVVLLSTDKAVYPVAAMGMSKAMMEKVMIAKSRNLNPIKTTVCATRYGNVMASRGSVIPLFVNQIKNNSSLTITDGAMTRFLMSLPESVDLVMHAFENAKGGDIFVQKSPAATIEDLASALLKIFASNSKKIIIGRRHGEKLYETLVSQEEMFVAADNSKFFRIPSDSRDLNYNQYYIEGMKNYNNIEDYTSHNAQRLNVDEIIELLMGIEYIKTEMQNV
jgi:UDP-glucose 4-epimerase